MNTFLFELVPVFLFFLAFKFYGIYVATVVGMASSAIQVLLIRFFKKTWDKKQLLTLAIFLIFGSMTLYFHNPIFVKWKPSIVLWLFSFILMGSAIFQKVSLLERMLEAALAEEKSAMRPVDWRILNVMWVIFLMGLGIVNLVVAYHASDNTWVNFKLYGLTGSLMAFSIIQAIFLGYRIHQKQKLESLNQRV